MNKICPFFLTVYAFEWAVDSWFPNLTFVDSTDFDIINTWTYGLKRTKKSFTKLPLSWKNRIMTATRNKINESRMFVCFLFGLFLPFNRNFLDTTNTSSCHQLLFTFAQTKMIWFNLKLYVYVYISLNFFFCCWCWFCFV